MTVPRSVIQMTEYPQAVTASLDDFRQAFAEDDKWWWRIGCEHHLALFEAALERIYLLERNQKAVT